VIHCSKALLLLIILLFPALLHAQVPNWSWNKTIHSPGDEMSVTNRLDSLTGDILIAGEFNSDISNFLGDGQTKSTDFSSTYGNSDGYVARFDEYGNELWAFKIGGSGTDRVSSLDIGTNGDIYVTGYISNGTCHFTGTSSKIADNSVDNTWGQTAFLAKYNANGALLWYRIAETPDGDAGGNIVRTGDREIYLSGYGKGGVTIGALSETLNLGGNDFFVVKYNPDGSEQWIFKGGTSEDDRLADMHTGTELLHIAVNYKADRIDFYNSSGSPAFNFSNSYPGKYQLVMCSYDKEGDNNAQYESSGNDNVIGNGITMIKDSLYVTGRIGSDSYFGYPVAPSDESDIFIASMSKWAQVGWIKTIPCTDSKEEGTDIDNIGNQYLGFTGNYHYTLDFWGDTSLTATDAQDTFLSVITSNGAFKWAKSVGGTNDEYSSALDGNKYGEIYLTGDYLKDIQFNELSTASDNGYNAFLAKTDYNTSSEPLPEANAGMDQGFCEDTSTTLNGNSPDQGYAASWSYIPGIIWKEDFNELADGTTSDTTEPSRWKSDGAAETGYAEVRSHKFEISDTDSGEVIWASEQIDISGYTDAELFIDLESWTSGEFEAGDSLKAYYTIDSGPETTLNSGSHHGAIGNLTGPGSGGYHSTTATVTGLNGNTLSIIIKSFCDDSTELYRFDNVFVVEASSDDDPLIVKPGDPRTVVSGLHYGLNHFMWTFTHDTLPLSRDLVKIKRLEQPVANPGVGDTLVGRQYTLQAVPDIASGWWAEASGPGNVTWDPGASSDTTTVTVDQQGTYAFKWTESNGLCTDDSTISVLFLDTLKADPGSSGDTCGLTFELKASLTSDSGTGYWTTKTAPGKVTYTPDSLTDTTTVTVDQLGTYEFTWTEETQFQSDDSTISVDFYEYPVAEAGEDLSIEQGEEVQLNASGGSTYLWSPSEGLSDTTIANPTAYPGTTTTYTVKVTNSGGCSDTDQVTLKVTTPDFAEAGPDTTICDGNSVQLYASGGVSYKWEPATGLSDRKTATPVASPHKTITYRVTVTNDQGLEDTAEVTVKVNPLPELKITNEYSLCEGDSIQLNAEGEGEFHWEPEEALSRNDVADPFVWPSNTTNYQVKLTNHNQCTNTAETTVKVYEKPRAYAGSDQTLDYRFETTLNARQPLTGAGEWRVLKGKGTFAGKSDPNTRVTNLEKGENTFLWKVDNGICPVSEDRVSITVKDLFVPTIITPNNDGKNDRFRIPGLKNIECEAFILFNRWGNEVYKEKNYKGDWNGTNKWGEKVTPDTYYYILKLKSGRVLKGHLDIEH